MVRLELGKRRAATLLKILIVGSNLTEAASSSRCFSSVPILPFLDFSMLD